MIPPTPPTISCHAIEGHQQGQSSKTSIFCQPGTSPLDIYGDPDSRVHGSSSITCRPHHSLADHFFRHKWCAWILCQLNGSCRDQAPQHLLSSSARGWYRQLCLAQNRDVLIVFNNEICASPRTIQNYSRNTLKSVMDTNILKTKTGEPHRTGNSLGLLSGLLKEERYSARRDGFSLRKGCGVEAIPVASRANQSARRWELKWPVGA